MVQGVKGLKENGLRQGYIIEYLSADHSETFLQCNDFYFNAVNDISKLCYFKVNYAFYSLTGNFNKTLQSHFYAKHEILIINILRPLVCYLFAGDTMP